ncbi:MAG TPA: hypothetical protein VIK32_02390 [Candidatus Limnocylindrales bacterium]
MTGPFREEVLNVELARQLSQRAIVSAPETIDHSDARERRLPDVMVAFRGLRVTLEGKTDDVPNARALVAEQARLRVAEGLAQIAIAVLYPASIRSVAFTDLPAAMSGARLFLQVHTEAGAGPWIPADGVDVLAAVLLRTHEQLVNEDVVAEAVAVIEEGLARFVREVRTIPTGMERLATLLQVREPTSEGEGTDADEPD